MVGRRKSWGKTLEAALAEFVEVNWRIPFSTDKTEMGKREQGDPEQMWEPSLLFQTVI